MKKVIACGVVLTSLFAVNAWADGGDDITPPPSIQWRPFVSIDYSFMYQGLSSSVNDTVGNTPMNFSPSSTFPNNFSGLNAEIGTKYGDYFGIGLGYFYYASKDGTASGGVSAVTEKPHGGFVDLLGFYPINNLNLVGLIGANVLTFGASSITNTSGATSSLTETSYNPEVGFGLNYALTINWGVEALFKYSPVSSRYLNDMVQFNTGIYYLLP